MLKEQKPSDCLVWFFEWRCDVYCVLAVFSAVGSDGLCLRGQPAGHLSNSHEDVPAMASFPFFLGFSRAIV